MVIDLTDFGRLDPAELAASLVVLVVLFGLNILFWKRYSTTDPSLLTRILVCELVGLSAAATMELVIRLGLDPPLIVNLDKIVCVLMIGRLFSFLAMCWWVNRSLLDDQKTEDCQPDGVSDHAS